MSGSFLGPLIQSAVDRFAGAHEPDVVPVDHDVVRTTLIQCEFELREMHRQLKAAPELGSHRVRQPSCRY